MRVAYFVHELADPAVRRRLAQIEAGGGAATLLGFERARFKAGAKDAAIILGRTRGGAFAARIMAVIGAMPRGLAARKHWAGADVFLARNLEMLMVAWALSVFAGRRKRIIYECLDIHRLMLGDGPASIALRALERAALKRASLLITSSPGFVRNYFQARQAYDGATLVVENKPLDLSEPSASPPVRRAAPGPPWRIAWCGVLRCKRSLAALEATARALGPLVDIELWGVPAEDQLPDLSARLAGVSNMRFRGRYGPGDLAQIYGQAHFAWAVDYFETGGNSDWLLPNRLYESLAFGAVPIAVNGVETAAWLRGRGVGVVLDDETGLEGFVRDRAAQAFGALQAGVAALDPEATRFTREEARALVSTLGGDGGAA